MRQTPGALVLQLLEALLGPLVFFLDAPQPFAEAELHLPDPRQGPGGTLRFFRVGLFGVGLDLLGQLLLPTLELLQPVAPALDARGRGSASAAGGFAVPEPGGLDSRVPLAPAWAARASERGRAGTNEGSCARANGSWSPPARMRAWVCLDLILLSLLGLHQVIRSWRRDFLLERGRSSQPRAMPWAILLRPFGAEECPVFAPKQMSACVGNPGRCPGLFCCAPSGQKNVRSLPRSKCPHASPTQGDALGYSVAPLRGRRMSGLCPEANVRMRRQPRAMPWAILLRPFGAEECPVFAPKGAPNTNSPGHRPGFRASGSFSF